MFTPSYIATYESGELEKRVNQLNSRLLNCDICPRECRINRRESNKGFCRSGHLATVSSYCDHHGEEPALSGTRGSGTIFFSRCNLRCVYCQNHQISQGNDYSAQEMDSHQLSRIMLHLQDNLGCHNINLVSPTHFTPQIVEAVYNAVSDGLRIPLVYNTNAYDSVSTLKMLDGVIDIYLPDIKYSADKWASRFSHSKGYVATSREAIQEMYRQVGNLATDKSGVAQRGLIVRHLILPNNIAGSLQSLRWLAGNVSRDLTLSVMAQYYPCHNAVHEPLLSRKITLKEYSQVVSCLEELGLENGWLQEMDAAENYLPDFKREGHPFSVI
ncbi:MAG: radical SAM protein [Chloroflexi bacterium]|nr:radical SAM protein [Chloroflexota bacterium]